MKTAEALNMYWIMDYRDCTVFSHFLATIALPYVLFQVLDHAAMHPSHAVGWTSAPHLFASATSTFHALTATSSALSSPA